MSVTMISRLMLRLHSNVASTSGNYGVSMTDFGSIVSTNMVFNSRLATSNSGMRDIETLTNTELNRQRNQSAVVLLLAEGEEQIEMDSRT
jgi:hypothetical protein